MVDAYTGAMLLDRAPSNGVEYFVITYWRSVDLVGDDHAKAGTPFL
jgi:hypothetical protein